MTVLVLNADYRPVNITSIRRAVVLLLKERAETVEPGEGELRAETVALACPTVIRLVTYVRIPRVSRDVTRRAVMARDGFVCQYCGSTVGLTIDHVVPRSKGGATSWGNVVASCWPCNKRKGSQTPGEAGMTLRTKPRAPTSYVFVKIAVRKVPDVWRPYLFDPS